MPVVRTITPGAGPMTLGSDHANDVVIAGSSPFHAVIELCDGQWLCADRGSVSGTAVNGRRIKRIVLQPGDRIGIGGLTLQFEPARPPLRETGAAQSSPERRNALPGAAGMVMPPAEAAAPARIALTGDITIDSEEYLSRRINPPAGKPVTIDFSGVNRITGDGWKLLLRRIAICAPARARFAGMHQAVLKGFRVLGLERLVQIDE